MGEEDGGPFRTIGCRLPFTIAASYRQQVEDHLQTAQRLGQVRQVQYCLALLALLDGQSVAQVAGVLRVHEKTVGNWGCAFCGDGLDGVPHQKSTGRPPKLTPRQQKALATLMEAGPVKAGCSGAWWRSPMSQQRIADRFGVLSNVFYIAQWLKNLGVSFQQAACVSDHLDEHKRAEGRAKTWPKLLRTAHRKHALRLWGDEASFPPWGTLTYTWARRGQQSTVKTSGKRKGSKVFGLSAYFTGACFSPGQEGRLNAAAYSAFLRRVLAHTTQSIILIQDGARYHTSAETQAFFGQQAPRLQVAQRPTSSPDYHPIEKLWKTSKQQETHLHYFPTFEALTEKVEQALLTFPHAPDAILALCHLPTALAKVA
jgi:transposase